MDKQPADRFGPEFWIALNELGCDARGLGGSGAGGVELGDRTNPEARGGGERFEGI
jgi:hypothetical protein